jgi:hypothetical protein
LAGLWHSHGQRCGHGGGSGISGEDMYDMHLPCMPIWHTGVSAGSFGTSII